MWWTCIRSCEIRSPYKKPACIGMKMAASDDVDDNDEESQGDECRLESSTYTGGQTNFTFDEIEKLGPVLNTKFVETSDPDV